MRIIDLTGYEKDLIYSSSSKGNLPKWKVGNKWYKTDGFGYESLCEVLISHLIGENDILPVVDYEYVRIRNNGREGTGCESINFLEKNERLITANKVHRAFTGRSMGEALSAIDSAEDCVRYFVDFISEKTGLDSFGKYLAALIQNDALFLNEDRHFNNIAVIYNEEEEKFRLCPVFDNGLSLCSALDTYPLGEDIYRLIDSVKARPFDRDYRTQLELLDKLYGCDLKYSFSRKDIDRELSVASEYYSDEILDRIRIILLEQMRKLRYMFR